MLVRFDQHQPRDSKGRWSETPLNMDGFDLVARLEGTFGDLELGVDDVGDVRFAFREGHQSRELDLGSGELAELGDALERLVDSRDDLPGDAESDGVYDDEWFGTGQEHKVELYGNGLIAVTFNAEESDPYTLTLDPPHEADPDDPDDEDTDDVQLLLDAIDHTLTEADAERSGRAAGMLVERKYNPLQKRDGDGKWTDGTPGSGISDALKLAGKIDLTPGEKLVGSGKLDGDGGGIRLALIDRNGERRLRFGAGPEGFGKRNREEGIPEWDGNPSRPPLSKAESERLDAEYDALDVEYDSASPTRQDEISARQDEIRELLTVDDLGFNGTAELDEYSMRRLADRLRPALAEAVEQEKAENKAWDEIEALEAKGNPDPDRMAELRRIVDRDDFIVFDKGIVPGSSWGDVYFSVELDDVTSGPTVLIGVQPKGAPDDWGDDKDWKGTFDVPETRKFLRQLDKMTSEASRAYAPESGPKYQAPASSAPKGGQFAVGGGRVGAKGKRPAQPRKRAGSAPPKPQGPMSFNGKTGTGYGIKGGDPRVRTLQSALNRLGLTDKNGKPLALDGKYGPLTTSAVKKLQQALGVKADGKVTPELLKQATGLKQLPAKTEKPAPRPRRRSNDAKATSTRARILLAHVNRALRLGVEVRSQTPWFRSFALDDIQISRSGDGRTVEAYAAMFDAPYEVRDGHGHYMEVIDRAAFNRTLSNGAGKSAMCLYNHGMSVVDGKPDPMAQIPIGTPLEIKADGRGLLTVTRYNKSPYADEILEAIRNGAIRSQSFRGRIMRSSPDRVPLRGRGGGLPTITRHELGLTDYGPTPIPVNAAAAIMAVRSKVELLQDFAALDDDDRLELLRTLGVELDGADDFEDEPASDEDDDTLTSDESELEAEDPVAARSASDHSGRQSDIAQRVKAGRTARGI